MLPSTAFLFPGQGSQSIGMLFELAEKHALITETFKEASEYAGFDLWQLAQSGPEDMMNQTEYTQMLMLAADVAVYRALALNQDKQPAYMAGHSLGEYAALVCAGMLGLEQAIPLVRFRGALMQQHIPTGVGAMAAIIGLTDEAVFELCQNVSTAHEHVMPANFNAPSQVVIAGHTSAIERAMKHSEALGARMAVKLAVSVPCHCSLLRDAALEFSARLHDTDFRMSNVKVLSNVDVNFYDSVTTIRERLAAQLYMPVRWVDSILKLKKCGVGLYVECGPAKVLSGLVKRIDKTLECVGTSDDSSFTKTKALIDNQISGGL